MPVTYHFHIFAPMGKKAAKRVRTSNYPVIFWEGLKDRAEVIAAEEHGGKLSILVNTAVNQYVTAKEKAKGRK